MTKNTSTNNKLKDWVRPKSVKDANPLVLTSIGIALSVAWIARSVYKLLTHGSTVVTSAIKLVVFINGLSTIYQVYQITRSVGIVPLLEIAYNIVKYVLAQAIGY